MSTLTDKKHGADLSETIKPTEEDASLVAKFWMNELCPYYDLIMFGNGLVCELKFSFDSINVDVIPKQWIVATSLNVPGINQNFNEGFSTLCSFEYSPADILISAGECCSHGSNGFIAVVSNFSGGMVWLAFFTLSDPFYEVLLEGNTVIAKSTSGNIYYLNLYEPQQIKVVTVIAE